VGGRAEVAGSLLHCTMCYTILLHMGSWALYIFVHQPHTPPTFSGRVDPGLAPADPPPLPVC
jgi:hypothetical protein